MKVLWLSPWLRPLARIHIDALARLGVESLLITSNRHPESDGTRDYEVLLEPRPKDPSTWLPWLRAFDRARTFRPDAVVVELVWDPRWLAFARLAPVVHLIHDDAPHDASEIRPRWQQRLFAHWTKRASRVVVFSEYVKSALNTDAAVVPLTSDLAVAPAPATQRQDFVLLGRIGPYKNVPIAVDAWRLHTKGPGYRGDRLIVIGGGQLPAELPPNAEWRRGPYSYADIVPTIAAAKGSLVHYRQASQSGVQLLSLQLGVTPIVSPVGGLPEFQPPGEIPVGVDDVSGLAAALDELADPRAAGERGMNAAGHYERNFTADRAAARLHAIVNSL